MPTMHIMVFSLAKVSAAFRVLSSYLRPSICQEIVLTGGNKYPHRRTFKTTIVAKHILTN